MTTIKPLPPNAKFTPQPQHPVSNLNDLVCYEFPLNERIRVFMRIEQLLQQIDHFMQGNSIWDSRAVIAIMLEILSIVSRNDLKSELLKELDRHAGVLNKMASIQHVDHGILEKLLSQLHEVSDELYSSPGKMGHALTESELFKSISQRSSIPGGTCAFDLPAYHYWLEQGDQKRRDDLERWLKPFKTIRTAIDLVLSSIRYSSTPTHELAQSGFYQKSLDHSLPFQMLRVGLSRSQPYFAEISGGKHRFTIRLMHADTSERPTQTTEDVEFQLTCCLL